METRLETGRGIFEVLAHVCGSPLEALRQFVENAADATEQASKERGSIQVRLVRNDDATLRELIVEDNGIGLSSDSMVQVLRNIGDSEKVNLALRGEKGIGILAFALIAQELHLNSRPRAKAPSACLVLRLEGLKQGKGQVLSPCPKHARREQGTTVHLTGILPEASKAFGWRRIKEYLGREFDSDLRRRLYTLTLVDGTYSEPVEPRRYRGVPVVVQTLPLDSLGHASVEIHMLPIEVPDASISLHGRSGVRICPITSLEAFQRPPWQDQRLEGYIRCDQLKLTANKASVVEDQVFWGLSAALKALEPRLKQEIAKATQEHLQRRLGRVLRRVDFMVDRFLRYLEEGAPLAAPESKHNGNKSVPSQPVVRSHQARHQPPARILHFELAEPEESQSHWRSWPDGGAELIRVNKEHLDFLEAEWDESRCARYLFALWAKEHLLTEYGSDSRKVADELVGWLNKAELLLGRAAAARYAPQAAGQA